MPADERLMRAQGEPGRTRRRFPLAGLLQQVREVPLQYRTRLPDYARDLRRLNDVLADSPLAGRYWVWGSLLLGWAREGRLLAHETADPDADFALRFEHAELFYEAVPMLEAAGYRRLYEFRNNEGRVTQHIFLRNGAQFDFSFFFRAPDSEERRFFLYGTSADGLIELEGALPDQPLESFRFLRRDWLKPADHESALTAEYGEWRIPDPTWSYVESDGTIRFRRPWSNTDYLWR
jgi:hypothetical protein